MKLSTTDEELETYLDLMKNMLGAPDTKFDVKEDRDKNFIFKYLYNINKDKIRDTLKSLLPTEFYKKVKSTNEFHRNEILYIWNPIRTFVDAKGNKRKIRLYIKTFLNNKNRLLVVVSFHEFNDFS